MVNTKASVILLMSIFALCACKENSKSVESIISEETEEQTIQESPVDFEATGQFKDLDVDLDAEVNNGSTIEVSSTSVTKTTIEELFQLSGIPESEYQEKLSQKDTLNQLIKQVEKNRKDAKPRRGLSLKGDISIEELTSRDTPTGVSIEDAILILQNELKGSKTHEKFKKVDSLSGNEIISKLPERDARKVLQYVYSQENSRLRPITIKAGYMHSAKEAISYEKELETILENYKDGTLIASPSFKSRIERSVKIVKTAQKKIAKKSKVAQNDFKKLNPDLYFGDEVGETFFGGKVKTAVYLPLGSLSFADVVVRAHHPNLNVLDLQNVLGEPDMIEDVGAMTVTGIYSLGLKGSLTVQFTDNALTNVKGPDLYIFEIGKIEPTNLEISKDGITWIHVGKIDGGVSEVDIEEFVEPGDLFYYVRLTDLELSSGIPGADVDAIAAIGAALRLKLDSKVLFETGESELKPEGIEAIGELAESISVLKKGSVIVEGHTDDVGDASSNKKLSLDRSKSVASELKRLIPGTSFKWLERGLGETKPIVKNDSDENKAKNRRVEILVVPN